MAGIDEVKSRTDGGSSLKYKKESLHNSDEIALEHFSGVSHTSKDAVAANPTNGTIAFPASSILVIVDPRYTQQAFIENQSSREISTVAFSDDGELVAYGESGFNPSVSICHTRNYHEINRFQIEGKCTIKALLFHPRSLFLVVLPYHDYSVSIYDFVRGMRLATTRWCVEPLAAAMTKMENFLVVCGHRKISYFYMSNTELSYEGNGVLDRHPILLGKQVEYTFIDIACGSELHIKSVYTVTSCGYLCEIKLDENVLCQVLKISCKCYCVKYQQGLLFVGCERGMVKICNPGDLTVSASVCVHDIFSPDQRQPSKWNVKSDILALAINPETNIITTLLSDQKRYSWRIFFRCGTIELAPVTPLDESGNPSPLTYFITDYEIQCNLAHTLKQLDLKGKKEKHKRYNFLQRPCCSSPRHLQVNAIKISPDGKEIVSGNWLGEIKVYDATTGELTKVIEAHSSAVTVIELLYNDFLKLVASGGRDRLIFILDAANDYHLVQAIGENSAAIISLSIVESVGILILVSSSADGVILMRRSTNGSDIHFTKFGGLPACVGGKRKVYNHSNGYIIVGQERGGINLFSAFPDVELRKDKKFKVSDSLLKTVNIDPTGSFLVAHNAVGQNIFHLQTGQLIATLCSLPGFSHLSFSHDFNYLINSNDSGCKFLWRLPKKIVDIMKAKSDKTVAAPRQLGMNSYMSYVRVCQQMVNETPGIKAVEDWANNDLDKEMESPTTVEEGGGLNSDDRDLINRLDTESYSTCTTCSHSHTLLLSDESSQQTKTFVVLELCASSIRREVTFHDTTGTPFESPSSFRCKQANVERPCHLEGSEFDSQAQNKSKTYKIKAESAQDSPEQEKKVHNIELHSAKKEQSMTRVNEINIPQDVLVSLPEQGVQVGLHSVKINGEDGDCDVLSHNPSSHFIHLCPNNISQSVIEENGMELKETYNTEPLSSVEAMQTLERINVTSKDDANVSLCQDTKNTDSILDDQKPGPDFRVENLGNNKARINVKSKDCHNSSPTTQDEQDVAQVDSKDSIDILKSCQSVGRRFMLPQDVSSTDIPILSLCGSIRNSMQILPSTDSRTLKAGCNSMQNSTPTDFTTLRAGNNSMQNSTPTDTTTLRAGYNSMQNSTPTDSMTLRAGNNSMQNSTSNVCEIPRVGSNSIQNPTSPVCAMPIAGGKIKNNGNEEQADLEISSLSDEYKPEHDLLEQEKKGSLQNYYKEIARCIQLTNSQETYFLRDVDRHVLLSDIKPLRSSVTPSTVPPAGDMCQQESGTGCCDVTEAVESKAEKKETFPADSQDVDTERIVDPDVAFSLERALQAGTKLTECSSTSSANSEAMLQRIGCVADLFRNQDDYLKKLKKVRRNFENSIKALSIERRNLHIEAQKRLER